MKPSVPLLLTFLLTFLAAGSACARHDPPQAAAARADPGPPAAAAASPAPRPTETVLPPSPEELDAFHAPVPK